MILAEIQALSVTFASKKGPVRAVDAVDLSIDEGSIFGIAGESGCGKTTIGLSLLGMIREPGRVDGKITVGGKDVTALRGEERRLFRWKEVSMVFQGAMNSLNPVSNVGDQITEVILDHTGSTRKEAMELAEGLLRKVRLPSDILRRYPHQLSGGQKQRVVIAMAIALNPRLIIADEPTTALDVVSQEHILRLLKEVVKASNTTVVIISHDLSLIADMCDYLAVMYLGRVVESGRARDILAAPAHPYTMALLESNITLDRRGKKVESIPGYPPSPINLPRNCRFSGRCAFATSECFESDPPASKLDDGRTVYCYHPRYGNDAK